MSILLAGSGSRGMALEMVGGDILASIDLCQLFFVVLDRAIYIQ